jgi:hypothetical protein
MFPVRHGEVLGMRAGQTLTDGGRHEPGVDAEDGIDARGSSRRDRRARYSRRVGARKGMGEERRAHGHGSDEHVSSHHRVSLRAAASALPPPAAAL